MSRKRAVSLNHQPNTVDKCGICLLITLRTPSMYQIRSVEFNGISNSIEISQGIGRKLNSKTTHNSLNPSFYSQLRIILNNYKYLEIFKLIFISFLLFTGETILSTANSTKANFIHLVSSLIFTIAIKSIWNRES